MIIVRIVSWAKLIGNGKELTEEMLEAIEEITMASGKAQAILEASRSSMEVLTCVFGDQVEEHLVFYETGEAPHKNLDIMKAVVQASEVAAEIKRKLEKSSVKRGNWKLFPQQTEMTRYPRKPMVRLRKTEMA